MLKFKLGPNATRPALGSQASAVLKKRAEQLSGTLCELSALQWYWKHARASSNG